MNRDGLCLPVNNPVFFDALSRIKLMLYLLITTLILRPGEAISTTTSGAA